MAPNDVANIAASQLLMVQAAQKLRDTVHESGQAPGPLAFAILELMENSAKLQQFDQMMAVAKQEAQSDEAKTWQDISLMTLKYCRQGLLEQQQRAVHNVCQLSEGGASLFPSSVPAVVKEEDPVLSKSEKTPSISEEKSGESPQAPPGIWMMRPPPGLEPPTGVQLPPGLAKPPPGFDVSETPKTEKPLPPWRRPKPVSTTEKEEEKPTVLSAQSTAVSSPVIADAHCSFINFDAYSSDED